MSVDVVEAMLEAQYMRLIASCIADVYGAYTFQFYKPSTREEVFIGFDQAWIRTGSMPAAAMYKHIRDVLAGIATGTWYWAFFLQFKRVEKLVRNNQKMKSKGFSTPYYRAEISLKPNRRTGKSQHEVLKDLSQVPLSEVYYACPMMFSRDDVYRDPDPDELRLVEVSTAPAGYLANAKHHIVFQTPTDVAPKWCSEPTRGKSLTVREWIESIPFENRFGKAASLVLAMLSDLRSQQIVRPDHWHRYSPSGFGGGGAGGGGGGDEIDDDGYSPTGAPTSLVIVRASDRQGELV